MGIGSGRLTGTVSAHTDTQYGHDELGRIITVTTTKQLGQTLASADDTNYFYDLVGNLDHIVYDSGVVADYTYDTLNRLDLLTHYAPEDGGGDPNDFTDNEIIASYDYALNADGSRASVTETRDGGQPGTADDLVTTITWTYDNINHLIEEVYSGFDAAGAALDYTTDYTFDLASNRLTMAKDTGSEGSVEEATTYTFDANDRLLTETFDSTKNPDDRHTVYAFGATDQTAKTTHEGLDNTGVVREQTSFTYNARGRMASTTIDRFDGTGTLTSSTQTEYIYNDSGIRTQQIVRTDADGDGTYEDVKTHDYLIDPANPTGYAQVLAEIVNTVREKTYILGHDVIAQAVDNAGTPAIQTLLYDGHGSTRALLDALALVLETYAYDAYGNPLGFDPAAALTALLYSGELTDAATGMQYLRARYYNPGTGRFNRLDPFGGNSTDPLSLHKYLYVHGNPIMGIDPSGLTFTIKGRLVVGSIMVLLIAAAAYYRFVRTDMDELVTAKATDLTVRQHANVVGSLKILRAVVDVAGSGVTLPEVIALENLLASGDILHNNVGGFRGVTADRRIYIVAPIAKMSLENLTDDQYQIDAFPDAVRFTTLYRLASTRFHEWQHHPDGNGVGGFRETSVNSANWKATWGKEIILGQALIQYLSDDARDVIDRERKIEEINLLIAEANNPGQP